VRIKIIESLKNDSEHFVGAFIEIIYFLRVRVFESEETSEFCEGSHDGDVD
jgi:D-mannonate dehydratase